jgi:hypothetical protein
MIEAQKGCLLPLAIHLHMPKEMKISEASTVIERRRRRRRRKGEQQEK